MIKLKFRSLNVMLLLMSLTPSLMLSKVFSFIPFHYVRFSLEWTTLFFSASKFFNSNRYAILEWHKLEIKYKHFTFLLSFTAPCCLPLSSCSSSSSFSSWDHKNISRGPQIIQEPYFSMCEGLRNTKNKKKADLSAYIINGTDSKTKFLQVQIPALLDGCNYIIKVYLPALLSAWFCKWNITKNRVKFNVDWINAKVSSAMFDVLVIPFVAVLFWHVLL